MSALQKIQVAHNRLTGPTQVPYGLTSIFTTPTGMITFNDVLTHVYDSESSFPLPCMSFSDASNLLSVVIVVPTDKLFDELLCSEN
eukprot:SM000020S06111  [mRNA]  locus=s20:1039918:1040373:- [translate_table: standard]